MFVGFRVYAWKTVGSLFGTDLGVKGDGVSLLCEPLLPLEVVQVVECFQPFDSHLTATSTGPMSKSEIANRKTTTEADITPLPTFTLHTE